jgi:hypothetical protein
MIKQNYQASNFSDLINYTNYLITLRPKKYIPPMIITKPIPMNINKKTKFFETI